MHKSNLKELTAMDLGEIESKGGAEDTIMQDMQDMDNDLTEVGGGGGKAPAVVPTLFDEQPTAAGGMMMDDDDDGAEEGTAAAASKTVVAGAATVVEKQQQIRTRRRRKLVVDDVKEIDSATMKTQLGDTSSILGTLELAPPTRQLMLLKEIGGVDKLFATTGRNVHNKTIARVCVPIRISYHPST